MHHSNPLLRVELQNRQLFIKLWVQLGLNTEPSAFDDLPTVWLVEREQHEALRFECHRERNAVQICSILDGCEAVRLRAVGLAISEKMALSYSGSVPAIVSD